MVSIVLQVFFLWPYLFVAVPPLDHNPFNQVSSKFFYMLLVVHGSGANSPHPECLAVGDAGLTVRWMTAASVEALVGVCWLGIKVRDQAVPVTYYFGV